MEKIRYLFDMLKETTIQKINNFLEKKTFNIKPGLYHSGPEMDFDYKFKIIGYTQKIVVGDWKDFIAVSVKITNSYNMLTDHIMNSFNQVPKSERKEYLDKHYYSLISNLRENIKSTISIFDTDIDYVTIEELDIELDENKPLNESDMSRIAIRTVVKDITKVLKSNEEGKFYLPEDIDTDNHIYSFENTPLKFQIELDIKHIDDLEGYMIDADFYSEDDVIDITLRYNPKTLKKNLYDIIGELNEIIAHELEHARQSMTEGFKMSNKPVTDAFKYYSKPQEILAQRSGFKRLSKLRKLPMDKVVREWFDTHKDVHTLSEHKQELIVKKILGE